MVITVPFRQSPIFLTLFKWNKHSTGPVLLFVGDGWIIWLIPVNLWRFKGNESHLSSRNNLASQSLLFQLRLNSELPITTNRRFNALIHFCLEYYNVEIYWQLRKARCPCKQCRVLQGLRLYFGSSWIGNNRVWYLPLEVPDVWSTCVFFCYLIDLSHTTIITSSHPKPVPVGLNTEGDWSF